MSSSIKPELKNFIYKDKLFTITKQISLEVEEIQIRDNQLITIKTFTNDELGLIIYEDETNFQEAFEDEISWVYDYYVNEKPENLAPDALRLVEKFNEYFKVETICQ